jgi:hypothetical protein
VRDEPDADAMPAASSRRQERHVTMAWAVRRLESWITTKMEITVPGVADGPSALLCCERIDRGGDTWVNEGDCLDTRQGGWRRHRLDGGSGRPRSGVAVDLDGGKCGGCLGGRRCPLDGRLRASAAIDDKAGGQLDISKRHPPHGHEAEKDGNAGWDLAITASPTSKVPLADVKYLGGAALCDAEGGEFGGGHGARTSPPEAKHPVKFWRG